MVDKKEVLRLTELAYQARRDLCKLCGAYSGNIHMGGDMSMLDVLTWASIICARSRRS